FRSIPTPGVLNSFYTIDRDNTTDNSSTSDGTKQEIDIELLTKSFGADSGEIHFALHASDKDNLIAADDRDFRFGSRESEGWMKGNSRPSPSPPIQLYPLHHDLQIPASLSVRKAP
ncbi:MAG: hypothetical protein ACLFTW_15720, partial [Chitinispirillaceae bacterium]